MAHRGAYATYELLFPGISFALFLVLFVFFQDRFSHTTKLPKNQRLLKTTFSTGKREL